MKSFMKEFLLQKKSSGCLNSDFLKIIPQHRVDAIINGIAGATIREIQSVARFFHVPTSEILEVPPVFNPQIPCAFCNTPFIPASTKAVFCSDACRNRSHRSIK